MKKIVSLFIFCCMIFASSLAATGHINGCTNTGYPTDCCTKTFNFTADPGYRITDVKVNGVSQGAITSYTFSNITSAQTLEVIAELDSGATPGGWNKPVLGTGLTPVNWNGSSWVATNEENWVYNYNSVAEANQTTVEGNGNGKWANAMTSDGSLYVWIPRFTYKITSNKNEKGNSWNNSDSPGENRIHIKFSQGITDFTSGGYIPHPAFTFGDEDLKGFWVAKYESSRSDATETAVGSSSSIVFKPGVRSSAGGMTSNQVFKYCYSLNRNLDSHLIKNKEWGAVCYLTNAIGRIPYVNNSATHVTGNAGGSMNELGVNGVTNAWNTVGGVKASTTHNVYGVYDLNGGDDELVAWLDREYNGISSSGDIAGGHMDALISKSGNKYCDYQRGISLYKELGAAYSDDYAYVSIWHDSYGQGLEEVRVYRSNGDYYCWDSSSTFGNFVRTGEFRVRGAYTHAGNDGIWEVGSTDSYYESSPFRVTLTGVERSNNTCSVCLGTGKRDCIVPYGVSRYYTQSVTCKSCGHDLGEVQVRVCAGCGVVIEDVKCNDTFYGCGGIALEGYGESGHEVACSFCSGTGAN